MFCLGCCHSLYSSIVLFRNKCTLYECAVCLCVCVCVWVLILLPNFVQNAAEIFLVKLSQVVRISKLTLVHSFLHMFAFQFEFEFVFYFRIPQN